MYISHLPQKHPTNLISCKRYTWFHKSTHKSYRLHWPPTLWSWQCASTLLPNCFKSVPSSPGEKGQPGPFAHLISWEIPLAASTGHRVQLLGIFGLFLLLKGLPKNMVHSDFFTPRTLWQPATIREQLRTYFLVILWIVHPLAHFRFFF